jgi:hypothetical protein
LSLQGAEGRFGVLHSWIAGLIVLARKVGMSECSFSRRYVEATGITPAHAVERLRVAPEAMPTERHSRPTGSSRSRPANTHRSLAGTFDEHPRTNIKSRPAALNSLPF